MGSCCSSTAHLETNTNNKPLVRKGAEGLLDFGLEYRSLPCDKCQQKNESAQHRDPPLMCMECSTRLYRIEDNALITTDNRKKTIPPKIYDQVARCVQEVVVQWLQRDYNLKKIPLFPSDQDQEVAVQALVSNNIDSSSGTLVIINGRGVARAGILSTRHTIESGVEKGSAVFHIQQALVENNMKVVCLDSNAQGSTKGLETVCRSLTSPALKPYFSGQSLYFLCHSAAGGNLVQHLLGNDNPFQLDQIQALVFTDSTHDFQWLSLRNNTSMKIFLQSDTCLYIRNNREHTGDAFGPSHRHAKAGEPFQCDDEKLGANRNSRWMQRFGTIRTVYAGTMDHSLMCYQARNVIWEFLHEKLEEERRKEADDSTGKPEATTTTTTSNGDEEHQGKESQPEEERIKEAVVDDNDYNAEATSNGKDKECQSIQPLLDASNSNGIQRVQGEKKEKEPTADDGDEEKATTSNDNNDDQEKESHSIRLLQQ